MILNFIINSFNNISKILIWKISAEWKAEIFISVNPVCGNLRDVSSFTIKRRKNGSITLLGRITIRPTANDCRSLYSSKSASPAQQTDRPSHDFCRLDHDRVYPVFLCVRFSFRRLKWTPKQLHNQSGSLWARNCICGQYLKKTCQNAWSGSMTPKSANSFQSTCLNHHKMKKSSLIAWERKKTQA